MSQVEAVNTPSSPEAVGGALSRAYQNVTGQNPPSRTSWVIPLAQAAVETAAFKGGLWNNNIGNITTAHPDVEDWFSIGGNPLKFRSFSSLDEGAVAMMAWLYKHGALPYADAGNVEGYVTALQKACYVGCDPGPYPQYQANIQLYVARFGGVVPTSRRSPWLIAAAIFASSAAVAYGLTIDPKPKRKR